MGAIGRRPFSVGGEGNWPFRASVSDFRRRTVEWKPSRIALGGLTSHRSQLLSQNEEKTSADTSIFRRGDVFSAPATHQGVSKMAGAGVLVIHPQLMTCAQCQSVVPSPPETHTGTASGTLLFHIRNHVPLSDCATLPQPNRKQ